MVEPAAKTQSHLVRLAQLAELLTLVNSLSASANSTIPKIFAAEKTLEKEVAKLQTAQDPAAAHLFDGLNGFGVLVCVSVSVIRVCDSIYDIYIYFCLILVRSIFILNKLFFLKPIVMSQWALVVLGLPTNRKKIQVSFKF